jgi:hypothetical protein
VALTPEGRSFVDKAAARLEDAFASLVEASRIDRQTLADAVGRLLTTLGPDR